MNLEYWIGLFNELAVGVAALATVFYARRGINAWRRQLKGTAEYDLARRYLRHVYAVRDNIQIIRDPLKHLKEPEQFKSTDPQGQHRERWIATYDGLWKPLAKNFRLLEVANQEAQVLWPDDDLTHDLRQLRVLAGRLRRAIQYFVQEPKGKVSQATNKRTEDAEKILDSDSDGENLDDFDSEMYSAVEAIERKLRKHIST